MSHLDSIRETFVTQVKGLLPLPQGGGLTRTYPYPAPVGGEGIEFLVDSVVRDLGMPGLNHRVVARAEGLQLTLGLRHFTDAEIIENGRRGLPGATGQGD
jgi:hypothetical protein